MKKLIEQFRTPTAAPCLNCGKGLNGASAVRDKSDRGPQPGDITVCSYCGHLMAFADDMTFRPLTDEEVVAMAGDKDMLLYQKVTAKMRAKRKRDKP